VLIRGFNDDEAVELAALARTFGVEMRFIEYMPLDSGTRVGLVQVGLRRRDARRDRASLPAHRLRRRRAVQHRPHVPVRRPAPPARIGFIAPVSSPFCGACSRLRITADGKVRPCLFSTTEWDLRSPLRAGATDEELADFLIDATWTKQPGHGITSHGFRQPERPMSAIGG
jgi:cyclic pyranopterin phosphate synthase